MMNPFSNPDNQVNTFTQSKLIKDLLKYSPDQLDNKEGELVNIIDKAINSSFNVNKIMNFFQIFFPRKILFLTYNKMIKIN